MASGSLAIAKASLAASLVRPDPNPLHRGDISDFHNTLEELLVQCSPNNIQRCKDWLVKNIIPSINRTVTFGKFVAALSDTFDTGANGKAIGVGVDKPPSNCMRLSLLYLVHDIFHHIRYHNQGPQNLKEVYMHWRACIHALLKALAAVDPQDVLLVRTRELLDLWRRQQYLDDASLQGLREIAEGRVASGEAGLETFTGDPDDKKNAPYIMPSSHGDSSTPFYDLPASNMMPHIIPNSTRPIDPQLMRPLQLKAGPAEKELAEAMKIFLAEVEMLDYVGSTNGVQVDIDDLGQTTDLNRNPETKVGDHSYYGWSQRFCDGMKKGENIDDILRPRSPSEAFADHGANKESWSRRSSLHTSVSSNSSKGASPRRIRTARFETRRSPSPSSSGSYSPPSPSAIMLSEDSKPVPAITYLTGPRARSPPVDPRRIPLPKPVVSNANVTGITPPSSTIYGSTYQPENYGLPPRPPNYYGPWPPPPPPPMN